MLCLTLHTRKDGQNSVKHCSRDCKDVQVGLSPSSFEEIHASVFIMESPEIEKSVNYITSEITGKNFNRLHDSETFFLLS